MPHFLLIDKPVTWTSHDVVAYLRGVTKIKKVGHAGTLDPFATGLLIVGVGREATKQLDAFKNLDKTYVATLKLGVTSDTYDSTGTIVEQPTAEKPTEKQIKAVLDTFIGSQQQIPPMYSAKKVKGRKLYELARKGVEIERAPHEITIYQVNLLDYSFPALTLEIACSSGTYIRTLAHDIGQKLGTGALCSDLRRTRIGDYRAQDARDPRLHTGDNWTNFLLNLDKKT